MAGSLCFLTAVLLKYGYYAGSINEFYALVRDRVMSQDDTQYLVSQHVEGLVFILQVFTDVCVCEINIHIHVYLYL